MRQLLPRKQIAKRRSGSVSSSQEFLVEELIAFVLQSVIHSSITASVHGVQWLHYPLGATNPLLPFSGPVQFDARSLLEQDETKRQLVVYAVIMDSAGRVMVYRRPDKQDETRLSNRYSIGVGGHVNSSDTNQSPNTPDAIWDLIATASKRELSEELQLATDARPRIVIAANESQVDRVHLGFVPIIKVTDETAAELVMDSKSGSIVDWLDPLDVRPMVARNGGELEAWSKLLTPILGRVDVAELPYGSIIKKDG